MGINSGKKEILQILENNKTKFLNIHDTGNFKIEYKYKHSDEYEGNYISSENEVEKGEYFDDSFIFEEEEIPRLNNPKLDVKKLNRYPYNSIGTISVQFPLSNEIFEFTCFLIDSNVVVTLASNLENKNKGGKAKLITTSFSKENVKWENIFIQEEEKKEIKEDEKDKDQKEPTNNLSSKLAVIIYANNINNEWLGIEPGKKEDYENRDCYAVFSLQEEKNNNIITIEGKEQQFRPKLRKILVNNENPFLIASKKGNKEDIEIIKQSPGSPIYYKDYNNGVYVIAIINEFFEIQYFDNIAMIFLTSIVNKGRKYRAKMNSDIDLEKIFELNLEKHNLGPSEIKYLTSFELKNLRILDLNSNSINAKGALFLRRAKYNSLEFLNLSNNKIGDEGLNHISYGFFSKLKRLHLSHNYITSEGICYLVRSNFTNNLTELSLSDNRKIGDKGIRFMKEHKGWGNLKILNLDLTGLTDIGLGYLAEASMPQLKELNIIDNKFTENGKQNIYAIGMNKVKIRYKIGKDGQVKVHKIYADEDKYNDIYIPKDEFIPFND